MAKIRLANDAEYNVSYCAAADGVLSFEIEDAITMAAAGAVFGDSARTGTVKHIVNGAAATYAGYTTLIGIGRDRWSGHTVVRLEKAAATQAIGGVPLLPIEWEEEDGDIVEITPEEG